MIVSTEFEAKVLGIDPDVVVGRILAVGGTHVADRFMRRYVFGVASGDPSKWIRLRDAGTEATLCVQQIIASEIGGVREVEVEVSDFDSTLALLGLMELNPRAYQENRRSSWMLGTVRLEIDSWPRIPPYLEIEADSVEEVHATAVSLGFELDELTAENATEVYARYGFNLQEIDDLRFPDKSDAQHANTAR